VPQPSAFFCIHLGYKQQAGAHLIARILKNMKIEKNPFQAGLYQFLHSCSALPALDA
jgi:hypothetical protein